MSGPRAARRCTIDPRVVAAPAMLRLFVVLALVADLIVYGWLRGAFAPAWPAPDAREREPERGSQQFRPELVKLMNPAAASAAAAAVRVACLQAGPFAEPEAAAAEAALADAGIAAASWSRETVAAAPVWAVYLGRFTEPGPQRATEAELRRLGVAAEALAAPAELAPGFVLARAPTAEAAEAALADYAERGVRGARVVALPGAPPRVLLRIASADAALQQKLLALRTPPLGAGFGPCGAAR